MFIFAVFSWFFLFSLTTAYCSNEESRGRSFDDNLCLKHRIAYIMWLHFGWIFNAYLRLKYLRHDSYKMTLQFLTTLIDEVTIGAISAHVSADSQPLKVLYWFYLRLWKFLPLKWKGKLKTRYFLGLAFWWVWKNV